MRPTFSATRESIAIISGSDSGNATLIPRERERAHPPIQRSTSGQQGEHRRIRVVHSVLQRAQRALPASPPAAEHLKGE